MKMQIFQLFFFSMRQLKLTYGFKGPERQELLRKSMSAHHDKVITIARYRH